MDETKLCILENNKKCSACGECMFCDLDITKICDNCCQCLEEIEKDYETIIIDEIVE